MKYYTIGICGPVAGLSSHQHDEIASFLRETLKSAEIVYLTVWRDTSSRHPVGSDREDGMNMSASELQKVDYNRIVIDYLEYGAPTLVDAPSVDTLFICPAHSHGRIQKSRVNNARREAETLGLRGVRVVFAWNSETTT